MLLNDFGWVKKLSKFDERFIKDCDENDNKRHFFEVDVEYPKNLFRLHSELLFFPERNNSQKFNKLACNVYDRENNVLHIRTLKQALNHGLILKKVHRVNEFNKESWLKP